MDCGSYRVRSFVVKVESILSTALAKGSFFEHFEFKLHDLFSLLLYYSLIIHITAYRYMNIELHPNVCLKLF